MPISKLLKTRQQQELYKTTVMSILTNEDIWERVTKDEKVFFPESGQSMVFMFIFVFLGIAKHPGYSGGSCV